MPFRIKPEEVRACVQVLPDVAELSPLVGGGEEMWLVGGAIRDMLLERPVADLDFATPGDPTPLARAFARSVKGHWFFLDEGRRQSRVAIREGNECRTCDFAPLRAGDLEGDLRLRDFTVNALAIPLRAQGVGELLDPLGALHDLETRTLRGGSARVFEDDPLRVLKGVRHAVILGFAVEEETAEHMRRAAPGVSGIAPERLRVELGSIFAAAPIASALLLMQSLDLARPLFGPAAELAWEDGTLFAARCEEVLETLGRESAGGALITEEIEAGLSRGALLKLAAFGRGFAASEMIAWGRRFKLSRRAGAILAALASLDPAPAGEMNRLPPGRPRGVWVAGLGRHPIEALILLGALGPGEPSAAAETIRALLSDFLLHAEDGRVPDLVDGQWVRERLGLPPGPAVGKVLAALRREETAGRVRTPGEGRKFLESFAKKWIDNP